MRKSWRLRPPAPSSATQAYSVSNYTVEAVWKAAQAALDARDAMVVIDDHNLTAQPYNEALAVALLGRLPGHAALLKRWPAALAGTE